MLPIVLGRPPKFALVAIVIYMMLPGSLIQPHQLASEAIYNPFIAIGLTFIVANVEQPFRFGRLWVGLAALAAAIVVRDQLLLFPFVLAAILVCFERRRLFGQLASVFLICFLFPLSWA